MMAERGTVLVPTLVAIDRIVSHGGTAGLPIWAIEKAKAVREQHKNSLRLALEMGIPIAFGTDTGTPFSYHGHQALEFRLMVECGMSPEKALASATLGAARLMRWEHQIGSVEAGKFADIAAFSGDPLKNPDDYRNCTFVMKEGQICRRDA